MYTLMGNVDDSEFHAKNRRRRCTVCFSHITRSEMRRNNKVPLTLDNPKHPYLFKRLTAVIPSFVIENQRLPAGVCYKCANKLRNNRTLQTSKLLALIVQPTIRISRCSEAHPCDVCASAVTISQQFHTPKRHRSDADVIAQGPRKRARMTPPSRSDERRPLLEITDYQAIQVSESSSAQQTARIANVLRERHPD